MKIVSIFRNEVDKSANLRSFLGKMGASPSKMCLSSQSLRSPSLKFLSEANTSCLSPTQVFSPPSSLELVATLDLENEAEDCRPMGSEVMRVSDDCSRSDAGGHFADHGQVFRKGNCDIDDGNCDIDDVVFVGESGSLPAEKPVTMTKGSKRQRSVQIICHGNDVGDGECHNSIHGCERDIVPPMTLTSLCCPIPSSMIKTTIPIPTSTLKATIERASEGSMGTPLACRPSHATTSVTFVAPKENGNKGVIKTAKKENGAKPISHFFNLGKMTAEPAYDGEDGVDGGTQWSCSVCTYLHVHPRNVHFLQCSMCGSTRPS